MAQHRGGDFRDIAGGGMEAAAQHGVLKGSYIVEVNGEKCDGLVQADVTNLLRKPGAREVIFALPLRKK